MLRKGLPGSDVLVVNSDYVNHPEYRTTVKMAANDRVYSQANGDESYQFGQVNADRDL